MVSAHSNSCLVLFAVLALAGVLSASSARATGLADFHCEAPGGKKAVLVSSSELFDVAQADIRLGIPLIYVNPELFRMVFGTKGAESVLLFVLMHECGHFQDGEQRQREKIPNSLASEEGADAWAMRELYGRGFTSRQFEEVFAAFAPMPAVDATHLPGAQRVALLRVMLAHLQGSL